MIKVQRSNPVSTTGAAIKGVQFLAPKHVADGPLVMKITKVTTDKPDNFLNPIVVFFENRSTKYSKGFKETSYNLIALVDIFGADEKKWIGKDVQVSAVADDGGALQLHFAKAK